MQTLKAYLYPNILEVQILDSGIFTVRKRTVYSRTITVYKGIDNPIQLTLSNQDNKPVNLAGHTVQVAVQNPHTAEVEHTFNVSIINAERGVGEFTIDKEAVNGYDNRFYKLTLRLINDTTTVERPLYIDDNYGVSLDLEVLPGYY